jgi:diguanylate cyclase (GGDEF)-like protein
MNSTPEPSATDDHVELPVLAVVRRRALELLQDSAPLTGQLKQLVEIDAVLTGHVMRVVRCPLYGIDRQVVRLGPTLERIGRPVLERLFAGLPTCDHLQSREVVERMCRHWVNGVAGAAASRWLSNRGAYDRPEEAYLAGLMYDAGNLLAQPGRDDAETRRLARVLSRRWRLGPRVAAVVCHLREVLDGTPLDELDTDGEPLDAEARDLLRVVAQGVRLSRKLVTDSGEELQAEEESIEGAAIEDAIGLELAHAARLLNLSPADGTEFLRELTNEELLCGENPPSYVNVGFEQRSTVQVCDVQQQLLETRGITSINQVLKTGLSTIHSGLGLDRLLLLDQEAGSSVRMRGRMVFDPTKIDFDRGLRGVEVEADDAGAIQRSLESGRVCLGGDLDRDEKVLAHLGVGVVVADQFFTGRPFDQADVAAIGLLVGTLGLVIENVAPDSQGKKLRALAEKDALTGINNRRNILQLLRREIDRSRRYGKPLSIALIDVDEFKDWNDVYGHQVGDMVLQSVAQVISSCSREIDVYGRYGGDEFLVVLPETPVDAAAIYAERLRSTIEQHGGQLAKTYPKGRLSISVGLTELRPTGDDIEAMIRRADSPLFRAKQEGRNRVFRDTEDGLHEALDPPTIPQWGPEPETDG